MRAQLMYVGITHETAPVAEREYYALNNEQKGQLVTYLKQKLPISALVILTTCNRTEVYFETPSAQTHEVRDCVIDFVENIHRVMLSRSSFLMLDRSIDAANHLLHVANGLRSAVIADRQIITQLKEAYLQALRNKDQGSVLERAFQAVFRSHRRVFAESLYSHGSTSTAYSSLKMIQGFFGKEELKEKTLLIIGAGEIAQDVAKYVSKFDFWNVFIANRTESKAIKIADIYRLNHYEWKYVEAGDVASFDAIITAVSNRKYLIQQVENCGKKRIWIDLALPSNIAPSIQGIYNTVYNIDEVTRKVESVSEAQLEAIPKVEEIISEELAIFVDWLKKDRVRAFLKSYKEHTKKAFMDSIPGELGALLGFEQLAELAEQMANELTKKSAITLIGLTSGELTNQQLGLLNEAFGMRHN